MISKEYKKAVELIRKEVWPITHPEDDLHKAVSVFKMLIQQGHNVGYDEIYQYLKDCGHDEDLASETQKIYDVVKATLDTEFGFKEETLRKHLFED